MAETVNVFHSDTENEANLTNSNRFHSLKNIALQADGFGLSDRATAAIVSATLVDFDVAHFGPVDRSKIRRERKKLREHLRQSQSSKYCGLYFDGRKDQTLTDGGHNIVEEHISVISEPNTQYLDHLTVHSGTSKSICESILDMPDVRDIVCVGCDSTAVNTGIHGGVLRRLELELGRSLHWAICMLHINELPLRHLFFHLDGKTSGPQSFCGEIGKQLENCLDLPIVEFSIIDGCKFEVTSNLSSDQQYFLDILIAVTTGNIKQGLENRSPGKLVQSRWLTFANRALRLYIGTTQPTSKLRILVEFIVRSYALVWFSIKFKPMIWDAARHFFLMIKTSRFLPSVYREIIDKVLSRNAYAAHNESIIIAMLKDDVVENQKLALNYIITARKESVPLRQFRVPNINLNTNTYVDMIDLKLETLMEPALTKLLSDEKINELLNEEFISIEMPRLPCHNQGVERMVKLVTQASRAVAGHERRDGYIRTRLHKQQLMPVFDTKSQFQEFSSN